MITNEVTCVADIIRNVVQEKLDDISIHQLAAAIIEKMNDQSPPVIKPITSHFNEVKIEKREGLDWIAVYQIKDDPEVLSMAVFGSPTIEDAIHEVCYSLDGCEFEIFSVTRSDKQV